MERRLCDSLTGIGNEQFLKKNYNKYIVKHSNANLIMIDLEKFKSINDTFGHSIGDLYLKFFASIIKEVFDDSIVTRIHGDEYVIVTKYDEYEITEKFYLCDTLINRAFSQGSIPKLFGYNCGSTGCSKSLEDTIIKADYLMYQAKKDGICYQNHSDDILKMRIENDKYLKFINDSIDNDLFSYFSRGLYEVGGDKSNILQIYTKNYDGSSIFSDNKYEFLKNSVDISKFDVNNLSKLFDGANFIDNKLIIPVDFKSLYLVHCFVDNYDFLGSLSNIDVKNIVLSINILGIDSIQYRYVIDEIKFLKSKGLQIRLDKFDSSIGDVLWEKTHADYIRINDSYWKTAMKDISQKDILRRKLQMYDEFGITSVFDLVENDEELNFLNTICSDNSLFSGNLFSGEEKLILQKRKKIL
jgi:diguanylate cyclase (GGDEF)-like protein